MNSSKKTVAKKVKEKTQDDNPITKQDERLKRSVYSVSTPRSVPQKSSTADIYSRQKSALKTKKSTSNLITTSIKPSTQLKGKNSPIPAMSKIESVKPRAKVLPFSVAVNSPMAKRRIGKQESIEADKKKPQEIKVDKERERKNTRTLEDHEVKVLNEVDNNSEMMNLTKKLKAQSKVFYVDLNGEQSKDKDPSEEEISYEDDFESYESDFDSYHSSTHTEESGSEKETEKQLKEENMLDSGNFDLRERSAKTKPMEFIIEDTEKRTSLTDEGFQDMSSSSAVSSMKTVHVEVLERPLFIDFTKSKENRRKRRIWDKLKQRAKDILSMVTLHQMSFTLFEMKPIPYELYMATFGRANYTQVAVQTFDDGITEEVQTDEIEYANKWTQYPIKFTKNTVHLSSVKTKRDSNEIELKINNLIKYNQETDGDVDEDYKRNALRIYLEQKDGAGDDKMLPYDIYMSKTKCDYNVSKLLKFLKKVNGRITNILSRNTGNTTTNLIANKKYPFSIGYISISSKELNKFEILQGTKIVGVVFSETKTNLVITIHGNTEVTLQHNCVLCLWDLNVAILEPIKVLITKEQVEIGRLRGDSDDIFVAALKDGTVHLWDLSEDANWNLGSGNTNDDVNKFTYGNKLRQSAYTSSASNLELGHTLDIIVGLEFVTGSTVILENGNKLLGQICVLLQRGIVIIYSIIQEKNKNTSHDLGKAFWSKIKLEKYQDINISDYIVPNELKMDFSLNKAKKRLIHRRQGKNYSRPKSAMTHEKNSNWESGIVCNALKIVNYNNVDSYLIGKNCGEVLIFKRIGGNINIDRLYVTGDSSSVTVLETSGLPYFLAATDMGTIHLCSLLEGRVLLTLDSRNSPPIPLEKCRADSKGRYLGSVAVKQIDYDCQYIDSQLTVSSLVWSQCDPFYIMSTVNNRLDVWNLTQSDIRPYKVYERTAKRCIARDRNVALLTSDGDVEIHKTTQDNNMDIFEKYISLL
ncbi:uncharacterized protein LOC111001567 [Pieris rapae]|uniref:uncharacterized protein LOC111001567 n=1 Tax=Pieris rapae TaxID=64459 RepID=UPI001E27AC11|nr:uncharacterized protein LOC111001567 [Pieris rapae]